MPSTFDVLGIKITEQVNMTPSLSYSNGGERFYSVASQSVEVLLGSCSPLKQQLTQRTWPVRYIISLQLAGWETNKNGEALNCQIVRKSTQISNRDFAI